MRRRKPDSIELQQMKAQAKEEKTRRQLERARLLREKELREEAEKELSAIEQRLLQYQEDSHGAQEALRRSEETAGLLVEKARLAEEEAMLLSQKAAEAEAEIQRIKISAIKTEEEKHVMQRKAEDAELLASTLVEESGRRAKESEQLRKELYQAQLAQKQAQEKLHCLLKSIHHSSTSSNTSLPAHHLASHSKNNSVIIGNTSNSCDVIVGSSLDLGNEINNLANTNGNHHNLSVQSIDYNANNYGNKSWCFNNKIPDLNVSDLYSNSSNTNDTTNLTKMVSEIGDLRVNDCLYSTTNSQFDNTSIYSNLSNSFVNYLNPPPASNNSSFCQNYDPTLASSKLSYSANDPNSAVVMSDNMIDSNSHEFANSLTDSDLQKLEFEVEKERIEYLQKSKHLQEQLQDLKSEIQVLKVEERLTDLDKIHEENTSKGETKYSTLKRTLSGTTKKRVAFFEEL